MESFDPALLFTPEKSLGPVNSPPSTSQPIPVKMTRPTRQTFFVSAPIIPAAQKKLYKAPAETSLKSEVEEAIDEVIGQYQEGNILYYFARLQGGIAHKYPSQPFLKKYGDLVEKYKRKKAAGELAPFDPSAHYIHPLSRVHMTVSINNHRATLNISSARSIKSVPNMEVVPDSQDEDEEDYGSDDEEVGGDDSDDDMSLLPRRSGRLPPKKIKKKELPFSPKKTRSRRVLVLDSDLEPSDNNELPIPTRRSTRIRKGVKLNLDTDSYGDNTSESSGYASPSSRSKGKKPKRIARTKTSRPAYGHFRDVEDLDYDFDSDEEDVSLNRHRDICEKCHKGPTHKLLQAFIKKGKGKAKQRRKSLEDELEQSDDEEERLVRLGGWVRCLKCPVVAHWQCLASTQRDEILKAARDKDKTEWQRSQEKLLSDMDNGEVSSQPEPGKRPGLNMNQTTEFICGACMKGGFCMGCMETALEPDAGFPNGPKDIPSDKDMETTNISNSTRDVSPVSSKPLDADTGTNYPQVVNRLLFRCFTCKRIAHYEHLPLPPDFPPNSTVADVAHFYAQTWLCADCSSYRYGVDKIIAWRPYPLNAVEPPRPNNEPPRYKDSLPREYLVKWQDRSYRRVQWVPHMWLLSTSHAKLRNFLAGGSKVELMKTLEDGTKMDIDEPAPAFEIGDESRASSAKPGTNTPALPQNAIPDAHRRIPPAWKTVDRVLDIFLWHPRRQNTKGYNAKKKDKRKNNGSESSISRQEFDDGIEKEHVLAFEQGEQPSDDLIESISEWERRMGAQFSLDDAEQVVWAFIKWDGLGYDEATWDSPPEPKDPTYQAFKTALKRFIDSRSVIIPKNSRSFYEKFDKRAKDEYKVRHVLKDAADLDIGQNRQLKLMPFQVDGFNWLCNNWWTHQHCILADEMGLGKTVQVATFLGNIMANFQAFPALVVVPNSTITNWVREFERWAPKLRVVPFYGEAKARDVIKKFELYHDQKRSGETGAKFHVLVTTYEALLNPKDFTPVFKNQPRWEVLVVDEGQRLKSDSSLLFRRLNELNSIHRIIMTGTPLNNNIRELFNLMNFLDPNEWSDLEALEKEHEELTEDLVKQLHNRLRPYFLRRIKSEVLQLPPKNEVIVPVSMAPLQKEIYRSILSHNLELLNGLTQPSTSKANKSAGKGRLNNVLMHLRKCLQHPYLYAEDIEPRGLSPEETHEKLIDASAKLRFLKSLLPKLRERGHRVLLFSQFVIALDVIEDFLNGEQYKYLRLDGNTKGSERQKGMDEFNKAGSEIFIYLLTTRAGGVGINLFSADTVIIFDPDFNPHQDLQAIARAYRFGQQKTCLVFKLMVKDSAEERIVQVGKKKLVLDHLIVQKMDDEDSAGDNVESILTYGAQALFDADQSSRDIIYTDHDIEKLIEKTEKEGDQEEQSNTGMSFAFAKIWSADKDTLEEVDDVDQGDSWAQTLQKITLEREKVREKEVVISGRGAPRRAAAVTKPNAYRDAPLQATPTKKLGSTKSAKSAASDGSAYFGSDIESDNDDDGDVSSGAEDLTFEPSQPKSKAKLVHPLVPPLFAINPLANRDQSLNRHLNHNSARHDIQYCGLCAKQHGDGPGECIMTERSENLAEYREMILLHHDDEPWEARNAAIIAIDETLHRRGHISLIIGQPLHLLPKQQTPALLPKQDSRSQRIQAAPDSFTYDVAPQQASGSKPPQPSALRVSTLPSQIAIAGSSKRVASPISIQEQPKTKRIKPSQLLSSCQICGHSPHHLVKDCPVVAEGQQSIAEQIKRLEADPDPDPTTIGTVRILRKILSKQKKKTNDANPDIINISD